MYKKWTDDEKIQLQKLYEKEGLVPSEISLILERTTASISIKIQKWQLKHTIEQTSKAKQRLFSENNNPMFGKKSWSNGLTKENNESLKSAGIKNKEIQLNKSKEGIKIGYALNPTFGVKAWNNGLTKYTDVRIKKYSELISSIKKEQWQRLPEEEKNKRRIIWAHAGLNCKKKETSIEKKMEELLVKNNIIFIKQHPIDKFIVDFYIPEKNLVIECLGDYWHSNPLKYSDKKLSIAQEANVDRDQRKIKLLDEQQINYLFFWEYDINKNINHIETTLIRRLQNEL